MQNLKRRANVVKLEPEEDKDKHQKDTEEPEFFDEKDRDFDGCLSFGEFMGEETPLEKVFKSMDKDGDGTITKEVDKMNFL